MPDYDFRSLSPYDFQLMCRDLLQAELRETFESFTSGPDGGVDLRCLDADIVAQCKHYAGSRYEKLKSVLAKSEVSKVAALSPERYILCTSLGLTPNRKSEIRGIFGPYCITDDDVYGRDDLNRLLTAFPRIEENNFKLWLTSEVVLRRLVFAGLLEDSERAVERARGKNQRYVQTPAFRKALDILEEHHSCIIAGIPGIGKTTLAEMLMVHYVDRHDFQPVRISFDFSQVTQSARYQEKLVFYFDDFLGTTKFDKLLRNEDARIIEFMEDAARNPRWRFIMTTREYILNQARQRLERLANANLDAETCVLDLDDYSESARAAILYNHIFFSGLSREHKLALLKNWTYRRIANHRNYNPRIVEHMTDPRNLRSVVAGEYAQDFIASLDNPSRIWKHAFEEQLTEGAQYLLLALASMPTDCLVKDLEDVFESFLKLRVKRGGFTRQPHEFSKALRELDGNFISTSMVGDDRLVSFHNPSVGDFLAHHLDANEKDVMDLLDSAVFFEQCEALADGPKGEPSKSAAKLKQNMERSLRRLFQSSSAHLQQWITDAGLVGMTRNEVNSIDRVSAVVRLTEQLDSPELRTFARQLLQQTEKHFESLHLDVVAYARIGETLMNRKIRDEVDESYLRSLKSHLEKRASELICHQAVLLLTERGNSFFSPDEVGFFKDSFVSFCEKEADEIFLQTDADHIRTQAHSLEFTAKRYEVEDRTSLFTTEMLKTATLMDPEEEETPEPEKDWDEDPSQSFDMDEMFRGLSYEIENLDEDDDVSTPDDAQSV